MPRPVVNPCGGEGEPPCPPVPATPTNFGDVLLIDGQNYVVTDDDQGQNENNEDTAA